MTTGNQPFEITQGPPTRIKVKASDGRSWVLNVSLGILAVRENPSKNPVTKDPTFEIQFGVDIQAEKESS